MAVPLPERHPRVTDASVLRVDAAEPPREIDDWVAVEEPLEIQAGGKGTEYRSVSVTMRTPGNDGELAAGFLFNEALIECAADILGFEPWGPLHGDEKVRNVLRVDLRDPSKSLGRLERRFAATSACGLCGKTNLGAIRARAATVRASRPVCGALIRELPALLAGHQLAFAHTGGLHATAVFDGGGRLLHVFEDVGRHNALDKAAGAMLLDGALPAGDAVVFVSGRVGFELVQKTVRMGAPVLCAIGAPSSLAIELARSAGLTLVGFVRDQRFNVYSAPERIES